MEPGLRDRENTEGCIVTGGLSFCRNGARPERPGKREWHNRRNGKSDAAMEPGLRDRENLAARLGPPRRRGAAMEPGLRDRENCSPRSPPSRPSRSRNGARPERPGKPGAAGDEYHGQWLAAMEPGLRDRENRPAVTAARICGARPQWSPA